MLSCNQEQEGKEPGLSIKVPDNSVSYINRSLIVLSCASSYRSCEANVYALLKHYGFF